MKSEQYYKELAVSYEKTINKLTKAIAEQDSKTDRLYSWLNDMRFEIAPDETTPEDERVERLAQIDIIDDIMEWLEGEQ